MHPIARLFCQAIKDRKELGLQFSIAVFNRNVVCGPSSCSEELVLHRCLEIPIWLHPHPMKSLQALDIEGASYSLLQVIYDAWVLQLELQSTARIYKQERWCKNKNNKIHGIQFVEDQKNTQFCLWLHFSMTRNPQFRFIEWERNVSHCLSLHLMTDGLIILSITVSQVNSQPLN